MYLFVKDNSFHQEQVKNNLTPQRWWMTCIQNAVLLSYRNCPMVWGLTHLKDGMPCRGAWTSLRNEPMWISCSLTKTKCWCCIRVQATLVSIQAGDEQMESSPVQKDLGILLSERWNMTQQWALAAQSSKRALGCIERSSLEIPIWVLHPALGPPTLTAWINWIKSGGWLQWLLEGCSTSPVRGSESWIVHLGEEKAPGWPIVAFQLQKAAY